MQGSSFDSFEKSKKSQKSFDDGTSTKSYYNPKKSKSKQFKSKSTQHSFH